MFELNESELASVVGGCGSSHHGSNHRSFKKIETTKQTNVAVVTVIGLGNITQVSQENANNGSYAGSVAYADFNG